LTSHRANASVTGKSALSYFDALYNEQREVKQLHARFPRPLKKAVLQSVHFQVEGKLDTLADKVHDRFLDRFFDDESGLMRSGSADPARGVRRCPG
jgi:4-hydroxy-L-threonine phosphate dehydrogenase PdxA